MVSHLPVTWVEINVNRFQEVIKNIRLDSRIDRNNINAVTNLVNHIQIVRNPVDRNRCCLQKTSQG